MTRSGGAAAILLLAIMLLAPIAQAASEAEGSFTTEGSIGIAGVNDATLRPLAFLVPDASGLASFTVSQKRALLCLHERQFMETDAAAQTIRTEVAAEDDCTGRVGLQITMTRSGARDGWVGIFPNKTATLNLSFSALHTDARVLSNFSTKGWRTVSATEGDQPHAPFYVKRLAEPHLYLSTPGVATFHGDGLLKVLGPALRITSREGTVEYATGQTTTDRPGGRETVVRWASIYLADATVTLTTESPALIAAKDAPYLSWDGTLTFTPTAGALATTSREYAATGKPERIEGDFTASLQPTANAQAVKVDMAGDLRETSIAPSPRPIPGPIGDALSWWPLALGAVVIVAAGGTALILRKRHHPAPRSRASLAKLDAPALSEGLAPAAPALAKELLEDAEDVPKLLRRARRAAAGGHRPLAALLFQHAANLAPENVEAWLGLGYVRFYEDRFSDALAAFTRASLLSPTGEADAMAATCLIATKRAEEAADHLTRALLATCLAPEVLILIRENPRLRRLIDHRPALKRAWDDAKARALSGYGDTHN